jgi:hypothetical protein
MPQLEEKVTGAAVSEVGLFITIYYFKVNSETVGI